MRAQTPGAGMRPAQLAVWAHRRWSWWKWCAKGWTSILREAGPLPVRGDSVLRHVCTPRGLLAARWSVRSFWLQDVGSNPTGLSVVR